MSDIERINALVKWLIFTNKAKGNGEIAAKLGYTESSFSQIINSKVPLSKKFVDKLSSFDENINKDWLYNGKGKMLKSEENQLDADVHGMGIPLIPLEAVAGYYPGIDTEGVLLQNCDHYVVPEFERLGAEYIIRVSGSSMYPKFSNGDVLACKKIKEVTFFQWGKVYVLDTQQGALVKRVFEHTDQDLLICHSDNKENYPAFNLPKSEIRSISIVLGVIRIE